MQELISEFSLVWLVLGACCGAALLTVLDIAGSIRERYRTALDAAQPRRLLTYILVDAAYVDAFCRDNPEMLRAEQCLHIIRAAEIAPAFFNSTLAKATLECNNRIHLMASMAKGRTCRQVD